MDNSEAKGENNNYLKEGDNYFYLADFKKSIEYYDKAINYAYNNTAYNDTKAYLQKARALYALNRNNEALECYEQALLVNPGDPSAYFLKIAVLCALNRREEAGKLFGEAPEVPVGNYFDRFNKGVALDALGDKKKALESYDEAILLNPGYADIYNSKGKALHALGECMNAVRCYHKAIELKPDYAEAYNNAALALNDGFGLQDFRVSAARYFNKAVKLNPYYSDAYLNKALLLRSLERNESAVECYDKLIAFDPDNFLAYYNKGVTLRGDHKRAIECFDKAIELKPDYAETYNSKGKVLYFKYNGIWYSREEKKSAVECFDKAIELKPDYAEAYFNKGEALTSLEEYGSAVECFDKAIELKPDYFLAYHSKRCALDRLGDKTAAEECLAKVKAMEQNIARKNLVTIDEKELIEEWNQQGNKFHRLKNYDNALYYYDKAIELKPDGATAYLNKGKTLLALRRYGEAIEQFDKSIGLNRKAGDAYLSKGMALYDSGSKKDALEQYNLSIKYNPDNPKAYLYKARALEVLGESEEALEFFNKAYGLSQKGSEKELIKKLIDIGQEFAETELIFKQLIENNFNSMTKEDREAFNNLRQDKNAIIDEIVDYLADREKFERQDISEQKEKLPGSRLLEKAEPLQARISTYREKIIEIQTDRDLMQKLLAKQEELLYIGNKNYDEAKNISMSIKLLKSLTQKLQEKLDTDIIINAKNKAVMQAGIINIAGKIDRLVNKEDIEKITSDISKLVDGSEITKGKLVDIEDEVERMLESQNQMDSRIIEVKEEVDEHGRKIKLQSKAIIKTKLDVQLMGNVVKDDNQKLENLESKSDISGQLLSPPGSPLSPGSRSPSPGSNLKAVAEEVARAVLEGVKDILNVNTDGFSKQEITFVKNLAIDLRKHGKALLEASIIDAEKKEEAVNVIARKLINKKNLFDAKDSGLKIDNMLLTEEGFLEMILKSVNTEVSVYAVFRIEYDNPVLNIPGALEEFFCRYGGKATDNLLNLANFRAGKTDGPVPPASDLSFNHVLSGESYENPLLGNRNLSGDSSDAAAE